MNRTRAADRHGSWEEPPPNKLKVAACVLAGLLAIFLALWMSRYEGWFPQSRVGSIGEWLGAGATTAAIVFGWIQLKKERQLTQAALKVERERWDDDKRPYLIAFRVDRTLLVRNTGRRSAVNVRIDDPNNTSLELLTLGFAQFPSQQEVPIGQFFPSSGGLVQIALHWDDEDGNPYTSTCTTIV